MATYKSIHTGKRVDDAVTKIPDSLPVEDSLILVKADGSASEYISRSQVSSDKLDKQTVQTETDQIYGKLADGSQTMFNVTMGAEPTTILRRDTAGRAQVVSGVSGNDIVNYSQLDTKYDKTGGTIGGNVVITGDLTVNGTQHINNTENLAVKNAMIYSNSDGATLTTNGGIGIKTNSDDVYGIVYNPTSDSVELGLGASDTNGKFTFKSGEGNPVAIRDDSATFVDKHFIQWSAAGKKLVDSGKSANDFENQITNKVDKLAESLRSQAYVKDSNGDNTGLSYTYTDEGGTLAVRNSTGQLQVSAPLNAKDAANKEFVENSKYAIGNGLNLTESTNTLNANIAKIQDATAAEITPENGVVTIPNAAKTTSGLVKIDSNFGLAPVTFPSIPAGTICIAAASSVDIEKRTNVYKPITPYYLNSAVKAALTDDKRIGTEVTNPTTFSEAEKDRACEILGAVRTNVDVALKSDLDNYVPTQSESNDKYYAQVTNENGIISARIFQNGGDDVQNLTIDKNGVKVLGKNVATIDSLVTTPITETETVVVDTTTVNFALDAEHDTGMYVSAENAISLGSTQLNWDSGTDKYKVIWDGVEYIVYGQVSTVTRLNDKLNDVDVPSGWYAWQLLGNGSNGKLMMYNKDTVNIPFAITQDRWKNNAEWLVYATTSTAATHTIKVIKIDGSYKKVTPEYQYGYISMFNQNKDGLVVYGENAISGNVSSGIVSGFGNTIIADANSKGFSGNIVAQGSYVNVSSANGEVSGANIEGTINALYSSGAFYSPFLAGHANLLKNNGVDWLSPFVTGYRNTIIANKGTIHPDAVFGSRHTITYDGNTTYGLNIVGGNGNTVKNTALSLITGLSNTVECLTADAYIGGGIIGGTSNTVNHSRVIVGGKWNTTDRGGQFIAGYYSSANEKAIVKIGNGTSADARANAFEVLDDNRAKVYGAPTENNDVLRYQDTAVEVETSLIGA